jgi:DNA repair exonuclease SbcCD nuclease subunit
VLAVADSQYPRPKLVPTSARRWNVLLLHGEVEGMLGPFSTTHEMATQEIPQEDLNTSRWDYIALGHYHVYRRMAPNQFYSGSLDYTSTNSPPGRTPSIRCSRRASSSICRWCRRAG